MLFMFLYLPNAFSDTWVSSDSTVSIGKVVVNGQDLSRLGNSLTGSGIKKTISRNITNFRSINSSGAFDIIYKQGEASLIITGDDNIIDAVVTNIVDHTLKISINRSYSSKLPIELEVSSPAIETITINGASNVKLKSIKLPSLMVNLSGSADLSANGEVSRLELNINGTGDVRIKSLISDFVTVKAQGAADVQLTARKELNARVSGTGDVVFYGHPEKVTKKTLGLGDIVAAE